MGGTAETRAPLFAHGKEPAWDWFWRCHGWKLLGRVIAALGAAEAIGLLGLALAQAEGVLLTFFFLLAVLPVLLAAALGATLAVGLVLSVRERRGRRSRRSRRVSAHGA